MSSFSGVTFVLLRFSLCAFFEAAALRSIVLRHARAPTATRSYLPTVCAFFCFCLFGDVAFGDVAFSEYFCTIAVLSLYGEYVVPYVFSFRMVFFYLVSMDWILDF